MSLENTGYNEETNIIVLNDEDGNDVEFEFLDLIEYKGEEYVVLIPPDDDIVVILRIVTSDDGNTEDFVGIEDEVLLGEVFNLFKEKNADLYDFSD